MTKLRMRRGVGHRRAAALMPPRWLRVFPRLRWALGGWRTGFPVGYGLTGLVAGGPEPWVRVRGRSTAAGPGGGAALWGIGGATACLPARRADARCERTQPPLRAGCPQTGSAAATRLD